MGNVHNKINTCCKIREGKEGRIYNKVVEREREKKKEERGEKGREKLEKMRGHNIPW